MYYPQNPAYDEECYSIIHSLGESVAEAEYSATVDGIGYYLFLLSKKGSFGYLQIEFPNSLDDSQIPKTPEELKELEKKINSHIQWFRGNREAIIFFQNLQIQDCKNSLTFKYFKEACKTKLVSEKSDD